MIRKEYFFSVQFKNALKRYITNFVIISLVLYFYRHNSYYVRFLRPETQKTLLYLYIAYIVFGFPYYFLYPHKEEKRSKGITIVRAFKRLIGEYVDYLNRFVNEPRRPLPKIDIHEKTAFLFLLVKLFWLPVMINFFFDNYLNINTLMERIDSYQTPSDLFLNFGYPLAIAVIYLVDTAYFSFGYAIEAEFLDNQVRSVEPTVLGWAVALASYPPFNSLMANYIPFAPSQMVAFNSLALTYATRIAIIFLLLIYLSATLALGPKCANLVNRGIVDSGPYAFIRHPAYICKNAAWWLMISPRLSLTLALSAAGWAFIYFLRAITEERHLIKDPDYQRYCQKVKYRFIPGII